MEKRKFDVTSVRLAIEKVGSSPTAIAHYLHCSTSTVRRYLKRFPELKAAYEKQGGSELGSRPRYTKEQFLSAIMESHGVKAAVAAAVGCSRQTVDNALAEWPELQEALDAARSSLIGKATSALVNDINNAGSDGHVRAYMFVLKTLGKDEGFVERNEVTGKDGRALMELPDDVAKMVDELGLNVAEVLRQFGEMVREREMAKGA